MKNYATIKPIPLDPQGYDSQGTYYGLGNRLWLIISDDGDNTFIRADNYRQASIKALDMGHDGVKTYEYDDNTFQADLESLLYWLVCYEMDESEHDVQTPDNSEESDYIEEYCKTFVSENQTRIIAESATGNDIWDTLSDELIHGTSIIVYGDEDDDGIRFELHAA